MLRLLLDEHFSPKVANGLRLRLPLLVVQSMAEWEGGAFPRQGDDACLAEAFGQGLTLVTYDRRTIPPLLRSWAEELRPHGGVIFVDERTISPADVGGLVRALQLLAEEAGDWDWSDRVVFLRG